LRLGNAGGAKDPDFWCAFEDGEVRVIGDDPENTINDRPRQRLLCRKAKGNLPQTTLAASLLLRVPFGEASRKSARPV
jgi:hypothetical protein